ncbi:hypothetical protein M1M07_11035 [Rhodococcus sp. HM1]|nr:hypothetical protein [Rhodococcus sp. CX]MCK8671651.1 hypothetical protein [Rhodococcus sp. HM1]
MGASQSAYTVSKHVVRVLAQSLAADLESVDANIGVSVLLPGPVRTRIFDDAGTAGTEGAEGYRQQMAAYLAGGGLTPAEVAKLVFEQIIAGARWIHPHPEMWSANLNQHVAELVAGLPEA